MRARIDDLGENDPMAALVNFGAEDKALDAHRPPGTIVGKGY